MAASKPRPVLVPVDGSPGALRALALACERVRERGGGQVIALNAQPPMPPSRFAPAADIRSHHERMAEEVFTKVEDWIANRLLSGEVDITLRFRPPHEWHECFPRVGLKLLGEKRFKPLPFLPLRTIIFELEKVYPNVNPSP